MKHFATEDGIDFVSQVVPASRRLAMEKHPKNYTRGVAMMITGHTSAAVARRPEFREHTLSHSPDETTMRVDLPPGSLKNKIPAREANESLTRNKMPPSRSVAGLLLMDSSLNPISFNAEAIQILGYPEKLAKLRHMDVLLGEKVRSTLLSGQRSGNTPFVTEFRSGRRHYFCRAFLVDAPSKGPSHPSIAVLLERGPSGLIRLSQVSQQFNLSQREGEALTYLLQGLSTKEIANRMNVSSNTVKVFLRLIMIKTGVSCRSAVVGKIMMTQP